MIDPLSGLQGIWSGMIGGICLQTLILIVITSMTNWKTEVSTFFPIATINIFILLMCSLSTKLFDFHRLKKQKAVLGSGEAQLETTDLWLNCCR